MESVYIVDAVRTPVGKYGGALASVRPDDLLAGVIGALLQRNPGIDPQDIEDVLAGAANQAGEDNRNVARMAALLAGLPVTVPGNTVNRLCASGMQSIMDGARQIACGDAQLILAGGVESMSRAPFVMGKSTGGYSRNLEWFDTTIGWRFTNPRLAALYYPFSMGETAENIAKQWKISREEQDQFALQSQQKYATALAAGKWNDEIIPVTILGKKEEQVVVDKDEHPRHTSLEKLAALRPAFEKNGTVTAGNAAGINDGAAMLLLASEQMLKKYNWYPLARIKSMATAGVDPSIMGTGPIPATRKTLHRAGLQLQDISLIELNEAFAVQAIACMRDLAIDPTKVNLNGGSISIGHPLGCSGTRIVTTLVHEMNRTNAKYGLASMCVGVGQGASMLLENC